MIFIQRNSLLVAIDLSSHGFGYAVFDGPKDLVDWGTRQVTGDRDVDTAVKIKHLLDWYTPQEMVLEDCDATGCQKRKRIRVLSRFLVRSTEALGIRVVRVAWTAVREVCGRSPRANKDTVASDVASLFPELRRHLPRPRKPWMSEDSRMDIFDAAALGVASHIIRRRLA